MIWENLAKHACKLDPVHNTSSSVKSIQGKWPIRKQIGFGTHLNQLKIEVKSVFYF